MVLLKCNSYHVSPLFKTLQGLLSYSDKSPKSQACLLSFERVRHGLKPLSGMLFSQISIWLSIPLFQVFAQTLPFKIRPLLSTPFEIATCHPSVLLTSSPAWIFSSLIFITSPSTIINWVLHLSLVFSLLSLDYKFHSGRDACPVRFSDVPQLLRTLPDTG